MFLGLFPGLFVISCRFQLILPVFGKVLTKGMVFRGCFGLPRMVVLGFLEIQSKRFWRRVFLGLSWVFLGGVSWGFLGGSWGFASQKMDVAFLLPIFLETFRPRWLYSIAVGRNPSGKESELAL